jgi:hypothetical protein
MRMTSRVNLRINILALPADPGYAVRFLLIGNGKKSPNKKGTAIVQFLFGSPSRTRTYNLSVNSRPLYR